MCIRDRHFVDLGVAVGLRLNEHNQVQQRNDETRGQLLRLLGIHEDDDTRHRELSQHLQYPTTKKVSRKRHHTQLKHFSLSGAAEGARPLEFRSTNTGPAKWPHADSESG
eukprot:3852381-Rhodomonas_salina.4